MGFAIDQRVILSGENATVRRFRSRTRPKGGRHCAAMTGSTMES